MSVLSLIFYFIFGFFKRKKFGNSSNYLRTEGQQLFSRIVSVFRIKNPKV